jgi:Family of unknown function (DUF5678)
MTVKEIQREQQVLMPKGDLAPYAGQWVALRNGEIIASDIDAEQLKEHLEVKDDDILVPVGHPDRGYFIL